MICRVRHVGKKATACDKKVAGGFTLILLSRAEGALAVAVGPAVQGAERIALNTPIQGSAADLIKLAMIRVENALRAQYPEAQLLLQVHDELIVECPEHIAENVAKLISKEMQEVAALGIPLLAEAKWGKSWYDAK